MSKIEFKLVSPSRNLLTTETEMVLVPGSNGYMGVMRGHAPIISTLEAGEVVLRDNGNDQRFFIDAGVVEISPDTITVLVENGMLVEEIDSAEVDAVLTKAEEKLSNLDISNTYDRHKIETEISILRAKKRAVEEPVYQ